MWEKDEVYDIELRNTENGDSCKIFLNGELIGNYYAAILNSGRFKPLSEYRNERLDEILNN